MLDVTGVWLGTWEGGPIGHGRITLTLTQAGTSVTGSLAMSGAPAISATDGPIEGTVVADSYSVEPKVGFMEGTMAVRGEQMAGDTTGRIRASLSLRRQPLK